MVRKASLPVTLSVMISLANKGACPGRRRYRYWIILKGIDCGCIALPAGLSS